MRGFNKTAIVVAAVVPGFVGARRRHRTLTIRQEASL
jgi:hypothetical protein